MIDNSNKYTLAKHAKFLIYFVEKLLQSSMRESYRKLKPVLQLRQRRRVSLPLTHNLYSTISTSSDKRRTNHQSAPARFASSALYPDALPAPPLLPWPYLLPSLQSNRRRIFINTHHHLRAVLTQAARLARGVNRKRARKPRPSCLFLLRANSYFSSLTSPNPCKSV